ncbi:MULTISPECIES: FAD-dependent monooxygenase [unclassified Acinetobacter]|uniref:FAD-dependent monooxygenase n=1 Tax=unclassified Acinetobacter TaxID=196816 RepID=UPI002935285A|nr:MULTISPECIES: FAD-dependent monooxygenase [unclassified Acinetobacter]WOE33238.1 FAD-dependent monooxygenase [Acinetobacter sp. SAAs470]WOE36981.1 FAD-dependent monooxygenase [Acinetobacter sp. SAAs474]
MHFPETQPRKSLYYRYQVYPYFHSQENVLTDSDTVTVVGAGPIGMVTALLLAKQGVKVVLLSSEQQLSEGSRALVYTKRSMEILQAAGAAERIMSRALPWTHGNSIYKGQVAFRMASPTSEHDQFAPLNNLQQNWLESYLLDTIHEQDNIEVRWGNKIVAQQQDDEQVTLTVHTPEGEYQHITHWVVAADGGRSPIRESMNLWMEGASYEGRFVIADIRIKLDYPTERLAFFSPDWNPGNTILMHREPDHIWRFDYQLDTDIRPEEALQPENLHKAVNDQLKMIGQDHLEWEMDWSTVYSTRALTLDNYVHNRIIFAGDSAHLLPIFGVRGANTGFQDAQDLAWKLAAVVKGQADQKLLNSYTADRVGAAREIIAEAGKSTRFMAPPSAGFRLLRDAVLSLSLAHDFVRPLYHWRTSRPHAYTHSPLNSQNDDNALMNELTENGALIPNVKFADGTFLYNYISGKFSILAFSQQGQLPAALLAEVAQLKQQGMAIQLIALATDGENVASADRSLVIDSQVVAERFFADTGVIYLVRPDHHINGRWIHYRPDAIRQNISQFNPVVKGAAA